MTIAVPRWFTIAAVLAIFFELIGVSGYVVDVLRTPQDIAKLPVDQQLLWARTPGWLYWVYAVAVFTGLAGAVGLLMRSRWSLALLGVSLLAVFVQFGSYFFLPQLKGLQSPGAAMVPLVVISVCIAIYWLAYHGERHGWIR